MSLEKYALIQYLRAKSPLLYGKAIELTACIRGWLAYVPNTFPHYTRHTVEHSEKIVSQLSKLLFNDDEPGKPYIILSSVEAYILVAAALLHDSGMVVADSEKLEILRSNEWSVWLQNDDRERRLREIESMREGRSEGPIVSNFVADVQLRFLIAEFVRARHHSRSGQFISQNQSALGRFALDDPVMARTIGDVCVGHGLDRFELTDDFRFPLIRDVCDEKVNVRLMAILLRLGDLLDMDSDRACPLLLSAASPLPANSVAHWSQYRCITHRSTTPQHIEIFAECNTQDEHRVLRDWCDWIESEVSAAPRMLSLTQRHGGWRPPEATLGNNGSIRIKPAPSATYVPSDWRFHLDPIAVLDRLINDTYSDDLAFVRELIQNAIDATRCQLFSDLHSAGIPWPDQPETLDTSVLSRYAILVKVQKAPVVDALTGATDLADEVVIEDVGTGMTVDVIENYFLQLGRSYYQSADFKRRFPFSSIGRFGVGFLSTFSASEHVVVDTSSQLRDGARQDTRITLTGPRAYLLREKGQRISRGTTVTVRLNRPLPLGKLEERIRRWCKRVEFPIQLEIYGRREVVTRETSDQFVDSRTHVSKPDTQFAVRALPFNSGAVRGELYVFEEAGPSGVRWDRGKWAKYEYVKSHPYAVIPEVPGIAVCENGIDYSDGPEFSMTGEASVRFDYRGPTKHLTMNRSRRALHMSSELKELFASFPDVAGSVQRHVSQHLETTRAMSGAQRWVYCQELMDIFPLEDYWRMLPETVRVFLCGEWTHVSVERLISESQLWTSVSASLSKLGFRETESYRAERAKREERAASSRDHMTLVRNDLRCLSDLTRQWLFGGFHIADCVISEGDVFLARWEPGVRHDPSYRIGVRSKPALLMDVPSATQVGFNVPSIDSRSYSDVIVLNTNHALVRWLIGIRRAASEDPRIVPPTAVESALELITKPIGMPLPSYLEDLNGYLDGWKNSPQTPDQLRPPSTPGAREFVTDLQAERPLE